MSLQDDVPEKAVQALFEAPTVAEVTKEAAALAKEQP